MDDLTLCKRIAEIEGVHPSNCEAPTPYDPLTDDALCFQLMLKYELQLTRLNNENYICNKQNVYLFINNLTKGVRLPNRAVCLAIIKAKKEPSDGV